jgi:2-aminoadipate transaminase
MKYQFSRKMQNVKASAIREIFKVLADKEIISFAGGNPAADAFPVYEIIKASEELLEDNPISVLQYGLTEGDPFFLKKAAAFINRKGGIIKEGDQIITTTGSQQIMDLASKVLCNEGDVVVVEEPSFLGSLNSFKENGCQLRGVPYKDGEIDLAALELALSTQPKPKFMYLIPNFQNPMGTTMSLDTRKKVLALAKQYEVLILEDDPYGELRFEGEDIPSLKQLDEDGLVLYGASFSKIMAPGMRVACAIANHELIEKMVVAKQGADVHTNLWAQKVIARLLDSMDMDAHLEKLRKIYKEKCELMLNEMEKHFSDQVTYTSPEGGMFIWVHLPSHVDTDAFVKEALKRKVAVVPGAAFLTDDSQECHAFRMNFSTPSREDIIKGVKILGDMTQAF